MAFTDQSDFFGSLHEDGINLVVRHLMAQRPSLFNYGTTSFKKDIKLFCREIKAADKVIGSQPLFTEMEPLPILGSPLPIGVNFCVQLTDLEVDFHEGNVFALPPELGPLPEQSFALRAQACAGLDCPSREPISQFLPVIETAVIEQQELAIGKFEELKGEDPPDPKEEEEEKTLGLPTGNMLCFCLEVFVVGHFEWGEVLGSDQKWLKPKVDGLEIVDIEPKGMEAAIECYATTVLQLGILPRLIIPMEKLVLDLSAMMKKWGLNIGKTVTLEPAPITAGVTNNPAVEKNELKAFVDLVIS